MKGAASSTGNRQKNPEMHLNAWHRLFRVVNIPTVPGDVFAGAAAVHAACSAGAFACAALASIAIYMAGLADNDIVGAPTDAARPIPDGEISMRAARIARALCLAAAAAFAMAGGFGILWWACAAALVAACAVYNRTKAWGVMGLCRGLDVALGASLATTGEAWFARPGALCAVAAMTLYVAALTKYSEGEDADPRKRRRVGLLVGAIVFVQLAIQLPFFEPAMLASGAAMTALTLLARRAFPRVAAS